MSSRKAVISAINLVTCSISVQFYPPKGRDNCYGTRRRVEIYRYGNPLHMRSPSKTRCSGEVFLARRVRV